MLYNIVSQNAEYNPASYELDDIDISKLSIVPKDKYDRADILKLKVKAIAKMAMLMKNMKDSSDILLEIKEMSPDGKIPRGLLMKGRLGIKDQFKEYLLA